MVPTPKCSALSVASFLFAIPSVTPAAVIQLPSLYFRERAIASGGAHSAATELVEGVENLQLMYGVDDNDDRSVDRYIAAGSVSDWETVLSVRVELTMVALDEGVVGKTGADNAQTVYDSEGKLINNSDGRMRQVFTSVFALRNRLP